MNPIAPGWRWLHIMPEAGKSENTKGFPLFYVAVSEGYVEVVKKLLSELEDELMRQDKQELVDFIIAMQSRGCFGGGIVHE